MKKAVGCRKVFEAIWPYRIVTGLAIWARHSPGNSVGSGPEPGFQQLGNSSRHAHQITGIRMNRLAERESIHGDMGKKLLRHSLTSQCDLAKLADSDLRRPHERLDPDIESATRSWCQTSNRRRCQVRNRGKPHPAKLQSRAAGLENACELARAPGSAAATLCPSKCQGN